MQRGVKELLDVYFTTGEFPSNDRMNEILVEAILIRRRKAEAAQPKGLGRVYAECIDDDKERWDFWDRNGKSLLPSENLEKDSK